MTEICGSAALHGAQDLLIINWHEGNIPALAIAAEQLHSQSQMRVATVQACYVADELYGAECNGLTHAGEIEALAVLASRPELVRLDRVDAGGDPLQGRRMDKLRRTRTIQPVLTDIRMIAPAGWYGDPSPATEDRGRLMMNLIAEEVARQAGDFFRAVRPSGRTARPGALENGPGCQAGRGHQIGFAGPQVLRDHWSIAGIQQFDIPDCRDRPRTGSTQPSTSMTASRR